MTKLIVNWDAQGSYRVTVDMPEGYDPSVSPWEQDESAVKALWDLIHAAPPETVLTVVSDQELFSVKAVTGEETPLAGGIEPGTPALYPPK